MRRPKDLMTLDLFAIPQPAPQTPGSMDYAVEIAHVMSNALKASPHDRYEVVARMSRLLGREITLNMLNAYTAESRDTHIPRFDVAVAFDAATEGHALAEFHAAKLGGRVVMGADALAVELNKITKLQQELKEKEQAIKAIIGRRR